MSVDISPSSDFTTEAGETEEFDAQAYDEYGNLVTDDVTEFTWTGASDGIFSEENIGEYDVASAYDSVTSDTVTVIVEPSSVDEVTITPDSNLNIEAGETVDFNASAYDEYGNLITDDDTEFTWEYTDDEGLFDDTMAGVYEVSAAYKTITSSSVTVKVNPSVVSSVEISSSKTELKAGEQEILEGKAIDEYGNLITENVENFEWVNASENGTFVKEDVGEYKVVASYDGVDSNVLIFDVVPADVEKVEIDPSTDQSIVEDHSINFKASAYDEYGNLITDDDTEFTWTNADDNGIFNKSTPDDYTIKAEYEDISSKEVKVTVKAKTTFDVTGLRTESGKLIAGEKTTFMVDVTNNGDVTGEHTFELKVDGKVVATDTVRLDPGETKTASIEYTVNETGEHEIQFGDDSISLNADKESDDGSGGTPGFTLMLMIVSVFVAYFIYRRNNTSSPDETQQEIEKTEEESVTVEDEDIFEEEDL